MGPYPEMMIFGRTIRSKEQGTESISRPLVSISPKFYASLFGTKLFCKAFILLMFGHIIFWCKNIGAKAVRKMLMKFTTDYIKQVCKGTVCEAQML
jgi:hypothetical protein